MKAMRTSKRHKAIRTKIRQQQVQQEAMQKETMSSTTRREGREETVPIFTLGSDGSLEVDVSRPGAASSGQAPSGVALRTVPQEEQRREN